MSKPNKQKVSAIQRRKVSNQEPPPGLENATTLKMEAVPMPNDPINNALQDGTGFMLSPREALERLKERGYTHNISAHFDHFEADLGQYKIFSQDFSVDILLRFENASDPSDQAIMYAISSPKHQLKGVFLEPYGLDQEELSKDMLERLKKHFH